MWSTTKLAKTHPELDLVSTPTGNHVAMVHCKSGAGKLNAWASMFSELAAMRRELGEGEPDGADDFRSRVETADLPGKVREAALREVGRLPKQRKVHLQRTLAHGGLFKTKGIAQRFLAGINTTVHVGDTATEAAPGE